MRPGAQALEYLKSEWDNCRFIWNELVSASKDTYLANRDNLIFDKNKVTFGYADQDKYITYLRSELTDKNGEYWLAKGSSVAQQQIVRDFATARTKALTDKANKKISSTKKRGLPNFKSRLKTLPSMNYTKQGFSLKEVDGRVRLQLPGKILIPVVWSRELPSEPSSARVYQDSLGDWYVSFVVEEEFNSLPKSNLAAGIDWGVTQIATVISMDTETGLELDANYDLEHSEHGKKAAKELAKYQKQMARRKTKEQTHGYRLAKFKAARTHKKIQRKREDDAHKWAKRVVTNHSEIAVENFNPKFLSKTKMARKASDAAIAKTKSILEWQALKAGRSLTYHNPAYSTMDCSNCGERANHRISLSQRTYVCDKCGLIKNRDKNAALNQLNRAGLNPASVDNVRLEKHEYAFKAV